MLGKEINAQYCFKCRAYGKKVDMDCIRKYLISVIIRGHEVLCSHSSDFNRRLLGMFYLSPQYPESDHKELWISEDS